MKTSQPIKTLISLLTLQVTLIKHVKLRINSYSAVVKQGRERNGIEDFWLKDINIYFRVCHLAAGGRCREKYSMGVIRMGNCLETA